MLHILGMCALFIAIVIMVTELYFRQLLVAAKGGKGITTNLVRDRKSIRKIIVTGILLIVLLFGLLFAFTELFDGDTRYKHSIVNTSEVIPDTPKQIEKVNLNNPDKKRSKERKKKAKEDQKESLDELDEFMKKAAP